MPNTKLKTTLLILLTVLSLNCGAQTVQRTTYAVFSPITPNDTLLIAGGQIMTGNTAAPQIAHGYYPLNHTLLSIDVPLSGMNYAIYPNPFDKSFQIAWDNPQATLITIEVYAINGALIEQITSTEALIEVLSESWESGMYYIRGITENGTVFNEKVIKS